MAQLEGSTALAGLVFAKVDLVSLILRGGAMQGNTHEARLSGHRGQDCRIGMRAANGADLLFPRAAGSARIFNKCRPVLRWGIPSTNNLQEQTVIEDGSSMIIELTIAADGRVFARGEARGLGEYV